MLHHCHKFKETHDRVLMTQTIIPTTHHDGQNIVSESLFDNRGTSIPFIQFVTSSTISFVKKFYFSVELWTVVERDPTRASTHRRDGEKQSLRRSQSHSTAGSSFIVIIIGWLLCFPIDRSAYYAKWVITWWPQFSNTKSPFRTLFLHQFEP